MKTFKQFIKKLPAIHCSIHKHENFLFELTSSNSLDIHNLKTPANHNQLHHDEALTHELTQHYNSYKKHQLHGISNYVSSSAFHNAAHWNHYKFGDKYKHTGDPDAPTAREFHRDTKNVDSALNQHKTPHAFHVYSAIRHHPGTKQYLTPEGGLEKHGTVVHHPAYMSTTTNKHVAHDIGYHYQQHEATNRRLNHNKTGTVGHVLKIHVPEGHPGAYVEHHEHSGQNEFILPRGTNLRIHPHPEVIHHPEKNHTTHVWHTTIEHNTEHNVEPQS